MNPDTHALAGAYAVNAVTEEERRSFELHLDVCADCRAEVAELRAAAATLATDVELPPPPGLRSSILSAVSQTRQLSPLESEDRVGIEPGPESGVADASATTPASGPVADELATRRRRRLAPWLAGVAAAALVAVGALVWQPWDDAPAQLTATEQVLGADDAQRVEVPMGATDLTLVRSPGMKRAVLVANDMPAPPPGKAYQLWLDLPGRGMVSAGMMPTTGATITTLLEGDAAAATAAGITLEPEGGSEHPTSDPIALFPFV